MAPALLNQGDPRDRTVAWALLPENSGRARVPILRAFHYVKTMRWCRTNFNQTGLGNAFANGPYGCGGAIFAVKFSQDILHVFFDGLDTDLQ